MELGASVQQGENNEINSFNLVKRLFYNFNWKNNRNHIQNNIILFTFRSLPLFIQLRSKASKISNISVYTDEKSCWQHIFPGFILVAVDENMLKNKYNEIKKNFQTWIFNNRFILSFLAIFLIILLISLILFMRAV